MSPIGKRSQGQPIEVGKKPNMSDQAGQNIEASVLAEREREQRERERAERERERARYKR